uniref:GPI transamidase subunit PIG-U n=1 Tax=Manihot esculenta TaxID=3983 RepID=A0A2C9WA98_MANES
MGTTEESKLQRKIKRRGFWRWVIASVMFRLLLVYFPRNLNLSSRPEVSTPLTGLCRSMYHGSPLLLSVLGPLTVKRIEGQPDHVLCSLLFVIADIMSAMLIRGISWKLHMAYRQSLKALNIINLPESSDALASGDIAALMCLWNPFTTVACVGLSTSPIENLFIILTLYGACACNDLSPAFCDDGKYECFAICMISYKAFCFFASAIDMPVGICCRLVPLAAFGWVMATHLSFYLAILIISLILLLGYGLDAPPQKLFLQKGCYKIRDNSSSDVHCKQEKMINQLKPHIIFFMENKLMVEDMSPNIGVLWYFFAEVFNFFRNFFLIIFHINILFMILPLAIRLNHRPCFLAFSCIAILSMLKPYPSVGDSALYLGLLVLFLDELTDMQFSFFLFCGYVGVSLLSPVMHNLWIWRGTGNANFYFATAIAYACLQIILVVENVSTMLSHDRKLRKLSVANIQDGKS